MNTLDWGSMLEGEREEGGMEGGQEDEREEGGATCPMSMAWFD